MRTNLNEVQGSTDYQLKLEESARPYYEKRDTFNRLKEEVDALNDTIKDSMEHLSLDKFVFDGIELKKTVSKRETFNECKLISTLKTYWSEKKQSQIVPFIKTVEYVDMDEFENFLYDNASSLPPEFIEQLNACKEVKTVVTLRVKQSKK